MALASQLPFGWVCFSNNGNSHRMPALRWWSQLPFGWVCFSNQGQATGGGESRLSLNCLSAGSVSLTISIYCMYIRAMFKVSIAFRLGLFL